MPSILRLSLCDLKMDFVLRFNPRPIDQPDKPATRSITKVTLLALP